MISTVLKAVLIMTIVGVCSLFAKEMVLTTLEGSEILLKDDSTWVYKGGNPLTSEEDFTVPVDGGKFVLIAADGTWGFVKQAIKKEKEIIPMDTVIGKGHALHIDVASANALAQKEALAQASAKMKLALKNVKIDPKKIADCVKRVEKTVDKNENFIKGKGWDVTIVLIMDRGSILAVADCAVKDQPAAADSSAVKR